MVSIAYYIILWYKYGHRRKEPMMWEALLMSGLLCPYDYPVKVADTTDEVAAAIVVDVRESWQPPAPSHIIVATEDGFLICRK